jgi:hypothetical protein
VIHVTTSPSEALAQKCKGNIDAGRRPIIITISKNTQAAEYLAESQGLAGRVDILDAEQFIATNLYELSLFKTEQRRATVESLVARYNEIIEQCETDASLKIAIG